MADKKDKQQKDKQKKQEAASTQAYLNIAEIKDGVAVLKDSSLRVVLMTSAVNFSLKSGEEQEAMIFAYQRFLNSLNHPIQILVHSRRLDLDYYLDKLQKRAEGQTIELVKLQTLEYGEFVKRLITVTNIMDKRFYVVVPFYPPGVEQVKGVKSWFKGSPKPAEEAAKREAAFQNYRGQLMQRVEAVASGLGAIGVRAAQLNSEELVELYYSVYNPQTSTKQKLVNVDELTAATVEGNQAAQAAAIPEQPAPDQVPVATPVPPAPTTQPVNPTPPQTPTGGQNG